jgi:hypothetical protein
MQREGELKVLREIRSAEVRAKFGKIYKVTSRVGKNFFFPC